MGMEVKRWYVDLTTLAREQLELIDDRRIREALVARIERLGEEPEKQGKALNNELKGFRSVRAMRQRYRIIYKLQEEQIIVLVVTVGIRKDGDKRDAYAMAKRLADLGLLEE